jgi:hypothetical protein
MSFAQSVFQLSGLFFSLAVLFISFSLYALQREGVWKERLRLVNWVALLCAMQTMIELPALGAIGWLRAARLDCLLYRVDEILTGTHPSFVVGT